MTYKNPLTLDVESTISNNGDPFDQSNKLVVIGYYTNEDSGCLVPNEFNLALIQDMINKADILYGMNFKFDLHWLRRVGIDFSGKPIHDIQLCDYILSHQQNIYPSLEEMAQRLFGEGKISVIEDEYWSKGIDTDKIPLDILMEYCIKDCELTHRIAEHQLTVIPPYQLNLVKLSMLDALELEETEYHGTRFNREGAKDVVDQVLKEKEALLDSLKIHNVPEGFNWGSTKQLSALLFGGKLPYIKKTPVGFYQTGARKGNVRYSNTTEYHVFQRKYTPPKGSEGAIAGFYSTDEDTLRSLGEDELISSILRIRSIDKLVGTYLQKLPDMQDTNNWDKRYIYGQYSQVTTSTGRLASSKPNKQNFPPEVDQLIISRYETSPTQS